jgi:DNA-binding MarR family transcriptional regulator
MRCAVSDLARSLGWSQSRLSHAMAWLRKSGWVRRIPCPTDNRSSLAQLTAKGRQKLTEAAPGHVATVRHLVRAVEVVTVGTARQQGVGLPPRA